MSYRKLALGLWVLTGFLTLSVVGLYVAGYRMTVTPSLPRGIYKQSSVEPGELQRGQIVSFCPPDTGIFRKAKRRGYIPSGHCPGSYMPLFKPVVAVAGDRVEVTVQGIKVNGKLLRNSEIHLQDQHHRLMPVISEGKYIVKPGYVWLVSTYNSQSFDSRYFGAVSVERIIGVMRPVYIE